MTKGSFLSATAVAAIFAATPLYAQDVAQQPTSATEAVDSANADAEAGRINDIVVTAQRRRETVQSVPIAISAFSSEQLQSQGVTNALGIGALVPNLVAINNTGLGSANAYYLRGLGNTESIPTFDPPVGTYVDDIYLSRQNANNLNFFDVERVEVLRGPQGTLFGRNTTGGAVSVILREPGDEFGGFAELGYGRFNRKMVRGSVDVPLAPTFSVKLSGYWQDDRGYVKNTTTGQRLNDDDGWGVRLGVKGQLSDTATWVGSYAHIRADGENVLNFSCDPANTSNCKGRFATTGFSKADNINRFAGLNISGRKAQYGFGNTTATDLVTSKFDFELADKLNLSLITGYVSLVQQFGLDFFDGRGGGPSLTLPNPPVNRYARGTFVILNDGQSDQFSQEVKLSGSIGDNLIDYVAGLFYIRENNRTDFADVFSLPIGPTGLPLVLADRTLKNIAEAKAGYAQADLNITEQIKLTAGIRYTDEKKSFEIIDNRPGCGATCLSNNRLVANGTVIPDNQRAKLWTPRFAVNFKPNNDILVFASATRGFKSGGWNARGTSSSSFLPFGPEKVWSYEAGFKSDLFDRRVRFNLTAFWLDVTALQTPAALIDPTSGAITFITRNFANYRNKGLEAELTVIPVQGLNLFANAGYQDDKYRLPKNAPAVDVYGIQSVAAQIASCRAALAAGRIPSVANAAGSPANSPNGNSCAAGIVTADGRLATPVRTPKFSLSFGGSYELDLGASGMSLVPSVNALYRTKQNVQTSNLSIYLGSISGTSGLNGATITAPANPNGGPFVAGGRSPAVLFTNAGLTLNGPDKAWSLAANCTNCFNQERPTSALANTTYINNPMTWMATARINF